MAIRVGCRSCGARLTTKDRNVGRRMRCPSCGAAVEIAAVVGPGPAGPDRRAPVRPATPPRAASAPRAGSVTRPGSGPRAAMAPRAAADPSAGPVARRRSGWHPAELASMAGSLSGLAIGFLTVAILAGLGTTSVFLLHVRDKDEQIAGLVESNTEQRLAMGRLLAEKEGLVEQVASLEEGAEQIFRRAGVAAKDAHFDEAERLYGDVVGLFPTHPLAEEAADARARMRTLLMERNLVDLGLTVSEPVTGWASLGEGRQLLYPQVHLRVRNVAREPLQGLHVRADFVAVHGPRDEDLEVLGDALMPVAAVLEPGMAAEVSLRGLGALDSARSERRPPVVAFVYLKTRGEAFRKVGAFPIRDEVAALR